MPPLVPGRHHRAVIVRVANILASSDRAEEWVWVGLHVWRLVAAPGGIIHGHVWLVVVYEQTQLVAGRSLIVHLQRKGGTQSPLDSQAVLLDIRAANILIFGAETHQANRVGQANILDQSHVLVEADGPWEFAAVICAGVLGSRQIVRRVQPHVRWDVVENLVVTHAEAAANYRVVLTEQPSREPWRVGKPKHGGEIVLIGVHTAIGKRDGSLRKEERIRSALGGVNR